MSKLAEATKGILFCSVIWNQDFFSFDDFSKIWEDHYGEYSTFSPEYNPSFQYYSKEMGDNLVRKILFTKTSFEREELVRAKLWATALEQKLVQADNKRVINIDPGILFLEQMLLSTGKPYAHRIYLGEGVYADLNYIYRNKSFQTLDWTYPDYAHEEKIQVFNKIRTFLT